MMRTDATAETSRSRTQRPKPPAFETGIGGTGLDSKDLGGTGSGRTRLDAGFTSGWPKSGGAREGGFVEFGSSSGTVCIAALSLRVEACGETHLRRIERSPRR